MNFPVAVALAALLSVVTIQSTEGRRHSYTKHYDPSSGVPAPWYTCTAQGNYPDPTTCDHYIACTAAHLAFQMQCAMAANGTRLHYVRDSGPIEDESYCDYPDLVVCDISPGTPGPVDPTAAPTTPAPGGPGGDCPSNVTVGEDCNPAADCNQCGTCDWYVWCNESGKWQNSTCDFRADPDGTVRVSNKLFWSKGGSVHGGSCVPWGSLAPGLHPIYLEDPTCKPTCDYFEDPDCVSKYFYVDPNFNKDIWDAEKIHLSCAAGTKWDQAGRTCVLCPVGEDCTCK